MSGLINFLKSKYKPSVKSNAIGDDGFTAANLIANDAGQLDRGFMCSDVHKLPIEIIFDFPMAIDIKIIKLWPSIDALRSTAFELHGRHNGNWKRVALVKDLGDGVDSVNFCCKTSSQSISNIAAAVAASATGRSHIKKVFFFRSAQEILASTNSIKLVILATDSDCSPVLGKIQMWGLPVRSLDKADKKQVNSIWGKISNTGGNRAAKQKTTTKPKPRHVPQLKESSSLIIPEEYLDAITCEIMIVPTVLPSGHVVDQSTIDKHDKEEAIWGRPPSDPFSGLKYTRQHKGVISLALKERIDMFLLENSMHFETLPRSQDNNGLRRRQLGPSDSEPLAKRARSSHLNNLDTPSTSSASLSYLKEAFQMSSHGQVSVAPTANKCISCRSSQFDYKFRTCHHLVCGICLVQLFKNQICICKVPFYGDDLERHQKLHH